MKICRQLIYTLLVLTASNSVSADYFPDLVVVITSDTKPLQNDAVIRNQLAKPQKLKIFNLDSVEAIENNIGHNLPNNQTLAKKELNNRINKIGNEKFNKQLLEAYQGILFSLQYQINRYPAIIFNGTSVIYGVTDLNVALKLYQQWQRNKESEHHE